MIDKNFMMAIVASMTLIIGYNMYYEYRFGDYILEQQEAQLLEDQANNVAKEQTQNEAVRSPTPLDSSAPSTAPADPAAATQDAAPVAPKVVAKTPEVSGAIADSGAEKILTINTGVTQIQLSNRGGVPVGYLLNKYHDKESRHIDLSFSLAKYIAAKREADQDVTELKKVKNYPTLGLKFEVEAFSDKINFSYYTVSVLNDEIILDESAGPKSVTYEYVDKTGIVVRKVYTFYPNSYEFDFAVLVKSNEQWREFKYSLVWYGLGGEDLSMTAAMYSYHGPVALANKTRYAEAPEEDDPQKVFAGTVHWAALTNRYYSAAMIPEVTADQKVVSRYIDDHNFSLEWEMKATLGDTPNKMAIFAGPKENAIMSAYTNGMYSIIDYGWFDVLAKPLFWVMNKFHLLFNNWGWSIIALTIIVKALMFPLTQKGFKSMQKLQKVQPHLKRIQETYKDDKEKLNQAMMNLYKEHQVNPLGGCLPMILQIPIFFALYKVLLESIELKGAGWILWIQDLSLQDPYYVTPVLMGASMLAQQMMTPSMGDPMQRKIMMMLPIVFTFMFLSFPAGLVIYWLVNNILTIAQQWIIKRNAGRT